MLDMEQRTIIGANVRRLRRSLGMSQRRLAELASVTSVANIEAGSTKFPRSDSLQRLAVALGVSVDALLAAPDRCDGCGRMIEGGAS